MKSMLKATVLASLPLFSAANSYAVCPSNPLELHAAFFDMNGDGEVDYSETLGSLKKLGVGPFDRLEFAIVLHTVVFVRLGDPSIPVAGLAKFGRHQGDTGIFDGEGAFDEAAFRRFFERFDADASGAVNANEARTALEVNARERGSNGAKASEFELPVLIDIAGDRADSFEGSTVKAISRERLLEFYQGTLFYTMTGEQLPSCAHTSTAIPFSRTLGGLKERLAEGLSADWDHRVK